MEAVPENVSTEEGLRLLKAGQVDQAIEVLGKVLQENSDDAKAHMYIGIAYNQKHDRLHSIHHLEESLRLEETPKGYYNLGLVYEAVHRVDEAIRQYRMALEMDPNYTLAQQALKKLHDQFEAAHASPAGETHQSQAASEVAGASVGGAQPAAAPGAKTAGPAPGHVPGSDSASAGPGGMPSRPAGGPPPDAYVAREIAEDKKVRDAQRELIKSGIIYGAICGAFLFVLLGLLGAYVVSISAGKLALVYLLIRALAGTVYGGLIGLWIGYTAGDDTAGIQAGAVLGFVFGAVVMLIEGGGVGAVIFAGLFYALFGAAGGWIIGKLVDSSIGGV